MRSDGFFLFCLGGSGLEGATPPAEAAAYPARTPALYVRADSRIRLEMCAHVHVHVLYFQLSSLPDSAALLDLELSLK